MLKLSFNLHILLGNNNANKIGIVRTLDPIMYNYLLLAARKNRASKAQSDLSKS